MMFEVSEISFSHGTKKIIDNVSFNVDRGEILTILGPNGVGKTTLLKCINNIYKRNSGKTVLDGKDITHENPKEISMKIGYIPQMIHTSDSTVFESVLLGRKPYLMWDLSPFDIEVTGRAIGILGLSHLSQKSVNEISGGEYQLVQIARAIAQQPKVILLDEPTNNLDIANQNNVLKILVSIIKDNNLCAVMTNHDLNLSVKYSDKLLMIKDGKVFAFGGKDIITSENIKSVYGVDADVVTVNGNPLVVLK